MVNLSSVKGIGIGGWALVRETRTMLRRVQNEIICYIPYNFGLLEEVRVGTNGLSSRRWRRDKLNILICSHYNVI